jgi:hypothetical protein
MTTANS